MVVHAITVVLANGIKAEQEYVNRWGASDWALVQQVEVSNGTKFIFQKHFNDEMPLEEIYKLIEETKKETAETRNIRMLREKIQGKKRKQ